jgi:predicted RNase H-like HicB family nuclease
MKKIAVSVEFDGGYGASINVLLGCVAGANSFGKLREMMAQAVEMHLQGMRKDGDAIPPEFCSGYELVYKLDAQALLITYDGILTKSALSRMSEVNEKQLWYYAVGKKNPRSAQREKITHALHRLGCELLVVEL